MSYFVDSGFLFVIILFLSCTQSNDQDKLNIKILPGYGVIVENDTIVLGKTSIEELTEKFMIDTLQEPNQYHWDGVDTNGKNVGGEAFGAKFRFKNIQFTYDSEIALDSIKLSSIFIQPIESSNVMFDSINLNEKNIDINELFSDIKKTDLIHGLHYVLFSYGISIQFSRKSGDFYISSISIFPKINR